VTPGHDESPDLARAAIVAALGLHGDSGVEVDAQLTHASDDESPHVRAAVIGAFVRVGGCEAATTGWARAIRDDAPSVRRRAAELTPPLVAMHGLDAATLGLLTDRLRDDDITVVEAAAYALGELGSDTIAESSIAQRSTGGVAVTALAVVATEHDDAIAREAAVGALGALGDPAGLPAVLAACRDKATVRRRAVLALAPFDGPDVDAALTAALTDRDWQVRQAAEDLTNPSS
jgi:HEAT repeat protein